MKETLLYVAFILPFISSLIMLAKYVRLGSYYCFDAPTEWWKTEEEKPRLFFFFIGLILTNAITTLNVEAERWQWIIFIVFALLANFFNWIIWTNKFRKTLSLIIKRKLTQGKPSPFYSKKLNLTKILEELNFVECTDSTFKDFLLGYQIEDKMKCSLSKIQLIRFIAIMFEYTRDTPHDEIKEKISHYFVQKNDENPFYIQDKASEISKVFDEQINKAKIYEDFKNKLLLLFSIQ
ncbi:MAG: hypothetical protein ACK5L5_06210 [Bacteroidales bacterium]